LESKICGKYKGNIKCKRKNYLRYSYLWFVDLKGLNHSRKTGPE